MTHDKFIELLNLYLDGELPPAQAAELEREIAASPDRHRIYRNYCQMQNACAVLSERFRDDAAPAPHFRQGRVVELPRRASGDWFKSLGLVFGGAAAACVAFVVIRVALPRGATDSPEQATPSIAATPVPATDTTAVTYAANPAAFRNPWSATPRIGAMETANLEQLEVPVLPVDLAVPDLKYQAGADGSLQPYGKSPNEVLGLEEIQAAAFQFQR